MVVFYLKSSIQGPAKLIVSEETPLERYLGLKRSAGQEYIGEEGFWGIFIAIGIVGLGWGGDSIDSRPKRPIAPILTWRPTKTHNPKTLQRDYQGLWLPLVRVKQCGLNMFEHFSQRARFLKLLFCVKCMADRPLKLLIIDRIKTKVSPFIGCQDHFKTTLNHH